MHRRRRIGTIAIRAAALVATLSVSAPASAQPQAPGAKPFEILDNSFLVEEAFNQERGVVQSIFTLKDGSDGDWESAFTQEWPLLGQRHQFSYTVPYVRLAKQRGVGDTVITYRLQASTEVAGRPALSPRISLIVPTGSRSKGLSSGRTGWQVNVPISKQLGDYYVHANGGFTHRADAVDRHIIPHAAASTIWRMRPMLNLMMEVAAEWPRAVDSTRRETSVTVAPGLRTGWNLRDAQMIVGVAVPIERTGGSSDTTLLGYVSYELPFTRTQP